MKRYRVYRQWQPLSVGREEWAPCLREACVVLADSDEQAFEQAKLAGILAPVLERVSHAGQEG